MVLTSNVLGNSNVLGDTSTQTLTVRSGLTVNGSLTAMNGMTTLSNLTVANIVFTGNVFSLNTNLETTNAFSINNFGTQTALKVVQYEGTGGGGHAFNTAEFWDYQTLAMVIDSYGNVGIHTSSSPNYALTVKEGASIDRVEPGLVFLNSYSSGIQNQYGQQVVDNTGTVKFTSGSGGIFNSAGQQVINPTGTVILSPSSSGILNSTGQSVIDTTGLVNLVSGLRVSGVNGTSGQVLTATGTGAGVNWSSDLTNINSLKVSGISNLVTLNVSTQANILTLNAVTGYISNIYTSNIVGFIGSQWVGQNGSPLYYVPQVGIGSSLIPTANLQVTGNLYVSNSIQTTNLIAVTGNVTTGNVNSLASVTGNVLTLSSLTANVATGNVSSIAAVTGNVLTLSSLTANVATGNVSSLAAVTGNVLTLSSLTANVATGNVSSLAAVTGNVLTLSSLTANVATGNVSSLAAVTGNVLTLSSLTANVATGNVSSLAAVTGNVLTLSSLTANVATGNVSSLAAVTGNVLTLSSLNANVATGNVSSLAAVTGNVLTLNAATANHVSMTVTGVSNLATLNVNSLAYMAALNVYGTSNTVSLNVSSVANVLSLNAATANHVSMTVTGVSNLTTLNVSSLVVTSTLTTAGVLPYGDALVGIGTAGARYTGVYAQNFYGSGAQLTSLPLNQFSGFTQYAPLYASATTTIASLASVGVSGQPLLSQGSAAPVYGTLGVGGGGTGLTSYTSGGLVYASGTTTLASSAAYTAGQVLYGGGTGVAPASSSSLFWDSGNTRLGIGAASPSYPLHVSSSATATQVMAAFLQPSSATSGSYTQCVIGNSTSAGYSAYFGFANYGSTSLNLMSISLAGYGGSQICITSTGVGIGKTNPSASYLLDVNGAISGTTFNATGFTINGTSGTAGQVITATGTGSGIQWGTGGGGGSSQWTGTAGNPIYYGPNVGVGTTAAPSALGSNLYVQGNIFASNSIQTTNIIAAGFTSNTTNTVFNFDTIVIPFINSTTLNVASVSNLSSMVVTGLSNLATINVSSIANIATLNALTTNLTTLGVTSYINLPASLQIAGVSGTAGQVLTATGTGSGIQWSTGGGGGSSQWTGVAGNPIYYGPNVGVGTTAAPSTLGSNLYVQGNIFASNALTTTNVLTTNLNVSSTANIYTLNVVSMNTLTTNLTTLGVTSYINLPASLQIAGVSGTAGQVLTATGTGSSVQWGTGGGGGSSQWTGTAGNPIYYGPNVGIGTTAAPSTLGSNLYVQGNIFASNSVTTTNVFTGNLVATGTITGAWTGTNQGMLLTVGTNFTSGSFAASTDTPTLQAFHVPLQSFTQSTGFVSLFSVTAQGLIKFNSTGLYKITTVLAMNAPVSRVALGTNTSSAFPTTTNAYTYVYTIPSGISPSAAITIPINVQNTALWYYLDVFTQSSLTTGTYYSTASASITGSQFGTYLQIEPFGNYVSSVGSQAAGLLVTPSTTVTLSSPITSNTYHILMTAAANWTVAGASSNMRISPNGNIQFYQAGLYEVKMCLNATLLAAVQFGIGSSASDSSLPSTQGPYVYQYAPSYTQDPSTAIVMPLNITDTTKFYYLDVTFPGITTTVSVMPLSTFVSVSPIGSFIPTPMATASIVVAGVATALSGTYTATAADTYIGFTGGGTVTLPLGSTLTRGKTFTIKDESGLAGTNTNNIIKIQMSGTDLLDGYSSVSLQINYAGLNIIWTGANSRWSFI